MANKFSPIPVAIRCKSAAKEQHQYAKPEIKEEDHDERGNDYTFAQTREQFGAYSVCWNPQQHGARCGGALFHNHFSCCLVYDAIRRKSSGAILKRKNNKPWP